MCTIEGLLSLARGSQRVKFKFSVPCLLVILFAACCPPPEVVVGAVRSDRLCATCLDSRRDNPILQGTLALHTTLAETGRLDEVAERNNAGFVYDNLQVGASVKGDDRAGASELDLIPNPSVPGSWGVSDSSPTVLLPWE